MSETVLKTRAVRDGEVGVWVALDSEVPGLVCEGETLDELLDKVRMIAPHLLRDNAHHLGGVDPDAVRLQLVVDMPATG